MSAVTKPLCTNLVLMFLQQKYSFSQGRLRQQISGDVMTLISSSFLNSVIYIYLYLPKL